MLRSCVCSCSVPKGRQPPLSAVHYAQIVLSVLSAWGIGIYTAMKVFGGKKEEPAAAH